MNPQLTPIEGRVLPFRRRSRAVRVRRTSPWLVLARGFSQALLVVGVPALVALWLFLSPTFALAAVELGEHQFVERDWVDRTLAPLFGQNLLRLELGEVRARLGVHPWVERVTVEKHLPDRLRIDLVERRPAALLRGVSGLVYLAADGRRIGPYDPRHAASDLLLVSSRGTPAAAGAEIAAAFALERELAAVAPDWAAGLSEIELLGEGDFRLYLQAFPHPLLVRAGTLAERFADLVPLLAELELRYEALAFIDLRFDRRIVFQPAPLERTAEWPRQRVTS